MIFKSANAATICLDIFLNVLESFQKYGYEQLEVCGGIRRDPVSVCIVFLVLLLFYCVGDVFWV